CTGASSPPWAARAGRYTPIQSCPGPWPLPATRSTSLWSGTCSRLPAAADVLPTFLVLLSKLFRPSMSGYHSLGLVSFSVLGLIPTRKGCHKPFIFQGQLQIWIY